MEQVSYRNLLSKLSFVLLAFSLTFSISQSTFASNYTLPTQAIDTAQGEALFKANCASCHQLYKKRTGPALFGVGDKYDRDWLYTWIKNSQEMVKSGDAQAVAIFEEYNGSVMQAFPQLTNEDIDNIIAYTYTEKKVPAPIIDDTTAAATSGGGVSNNIILGILALVFLMLVVALFAVNRTLRTFADKQGIEVPKKEPRPAVWKLFVQNQFLVLVTSIFLLLAAGYYMYGWMMQVGIDEGYAPVQPIHYSHRIHAGTNQIDCKYCHSSARKSKHSGIPSLNVCMNCHKNIAEVAAETQAEGLDEYGVDYNAEIQKLYAAVGWDEGAQAYTGEEKPVKWVRIHNLPDFAYFNHSQHVTVAGVECQKCHGPVEEMEIMSQFAPLTMGWCINCHRETNVDTENNEYYVKIHEELSKKYGKDKLTIAELGGLECGKCHY
ncbi:MAG: c-type cytochrome [Bacteroidia bacterium]|nr:c-type cytochrome [Bacteroidia bacterium]NNM24100.1 c-type cytochrome [Flavobacteriaceae bacterium]